MLVNQLCLPEEWNEQNLVSSIIWLIREEYKQINKAYVDRASEIASIEAARAAKIETLKSCDPSFGLGPFEEFPPLEKDSHYQRLVKEKENAKLWLKYYEACIAYVELHLIKKAHPDKKGD